MRNQSAVWGKNSAIRSAAVPSPLASGKSIIRFRARISPVEREYPGGVGMPSDICTPMVPAIRQGARADSTVVATAPAAGLPRPDMPVLAVVVTPRASAVRPMYALVRRGVRIRWRVCGMEIAFGSAAAGLPGLRSVRSHSAGRAAPARRERPNVDRLVAQVTRASEITGDRIPVCM